MTEMTSQSSVGQTRITPQFGLNRNIDGAARDVEAAINAARADLPTALRQNPTYRKVNPADAPVMIIALTSKTLTQGQLYDSAATVLEQKLSQMPGVGEVDVNGSALPAVRVELNPGGFSTMASVWKMCVRRSRRPTPTRRKVQSKRARSTSSSIERPGAPCGRLPPSRRRLSQRRAVRLTDVADVLDSVEDIRNSGLFNGQTRGADRVPPAGRQHHFHGQRDTRRPAATGGLAAGGTNVSIAIDRTRPVRASLNDTQRTLLIAIVLVIAVVFVFLPVAARHADPGGGAAVSIIGTFGPCISSASAWTIFR